MAIDPNPCYPKSPFIWCDLCGWGDTIIGDADGVMHFCRRHKADEVKRFLDGEIPGYFEQNDVKNRG